MDTGSLATRGEELAARYLESRGLTIVERNWRCRAGEIDIVALDERVLVFCEVKTRRGDRAGTPEEAVHRDKRRRILRLAGVYLARNALQDVDVRFDVVSVSVSGDRALVRHLPSAFDGSE